MSDKELPVTIKVFPATREKLRMAAPLAKEGHMELIDRLVSREYEKLLKKFKKSIK